MGVTSDNRPAMNVTRPPPAASDRCRPGFQVGPRGGLRSHRRRGAGERGDDTCGVETNGRMDREDVDGHRWTVFDWLASLTLGVQPG